jgi:hypothetical protein
MEVYPLHSVRSGALLMIYVFQTAGCSDVLSISAQHDACVVFPTFQHALHWWPIYRNWFDEAHGTDCTYKSKTAIVTRCNHRALRLWVPVSTRGRTTEAEIPMDYRPDRLSGKWWFFSQYFHRADLRDLVEGI